MSVYGLDNAPDELPPHIQEQLRDLHRLDAELAHLESKLDETRRQRDIVHCQLERFCELRAPIRRAPYEVLAIIFDSHPEDQYNRNSTLMRVCKLWHQIVINTPKLWNYISLELTKIEGLTLLWRYARTCLAYSGNLPLHIRLDARKFEPENNFSVVGAEFYHTILPQYSYELNSDPAQTLVGTICDEERENSRANVYECALLMTLAILRGEEDRFLKDWSSFHCYIYLPYESNIVVDTIAARIWDSIDGKTENLVDLALIPHYSSNNGWHPTGFPNLKSLKSFSARLDVKPDQLQLPIANLEQLILLNDICNDDLLTFTSGKFVSLQILQLDIYNLAITDSMQTIHLPALEALALLGYRYGPVMRLLVTPRLTHLSLRCRTPTEIDTSSIPSTVTDIMWTLLITHDMTEVAELLAALGSLRRIHVRREEPATQSIAPILGLRPDVYCTEDTAEWPYIIPFVEE